MNESRVRGTAATSNGILGTTPLWSRSRGTLDRSAVAGTPTAVHLRRVVG